MRLPGWTAVLAGGALLAALAAPAPGQTGDGKAEVLALYRRAEALNREGKWAEASKLYEEAIRKAKDAFGPNDRNTSNLMNNLGVIYKNLGEYEKAKAVYQQSLELTKARVGEEHPSFATSLGNLAGLYHRMGQHARAEKLFLRSLKIREAKLPSDDPSIAGDLNNLAGLYQDMGRHAKSEALFQRSLEILKAKPDKNRLNVAITLNNLARLQQAMGQHAKAEQSYVGSLTIIVRTVGPDHPYVATILGGAASLYEAMGQFTKAEPLMKRCLELTEKHVPEDHPNVARAMNNLGKLYHSMGKYAQAEPLLKRALAINEKLGKDHPDVATPLNNLAQLYVDVGQPERAEPLFRRSLAISERAWGKDHPDVAEVLSNLAGLHARTGKAAEAARLFDRARRGWRRHFASVLPAVSDAEKAAFFSNTDARGALYRALSLALAHRAEADLAGRAATWLVNGKAVDQESLASSLLLTRQGSDPALGARAQQLLSVREQLARLTFGTASTGQENARSEKIEKLSAQEQELARALRQDGSKAVQAPWVELDDLRKGLPADAVLIDVAHFRVLDFKAKPGEKDWGPARYAAWVTPKSGPVHLIDLGPADQIDAVILQFRQAMHPLKGPTGLFARLKKHGEEKEEKALREHLDALAKLVLAPLLPHIGKSKKWLVSPDGNLWLFPWEALTLPDGKYAIEDHEIAYLTSGRDLLSAPAARVKAGAPVVLADPDYDLVPQAAGKAKHPAAGSTDEEAPRARLPKVDRLESTGGEARAIVPILKDYTGLVPQLHLRGQALEEVVKAAHGPRVLVLATHGFFLADQQLDTRGSKGAARPKAAGKWENPLLRCGLLLAGCNNAGKATTGDDGVLTGLEVVGADLRGCELVVLSACETGLGEVQSGEGVAGLRQAFQLAGARAVVSTLWQVPSKQTARLMGFFFQNLGKGMSKAEALRAAKVKVIEERRDDYASAHPFFWAAFTLTGQP
jgi:CHAT domain-containing protein/Tfp pilus assembly protein PilF